MNARLRRLPLPVLLGSMLVVGLCALLALNTASAAQELKQRALTDNNANTSDVEQQLLRDLAAKQAPAALAAAAQAQGLVPNPNPAFLRFNADGSVAVLGSPMPATVAPPPVTAAPSKSPSVSPSKSPSASGKASATASKSGAAKSSHAVASATGGRSQAAAPPIVTVTRPVPASTPTTRPGATSILPGAHR